MNVSSRVIVLSEKHRPGVIFDGILEVEVGEGPLADRTLQALRKRGYTIENDDFMFFPEAAINNRMTVVQEDRAYRVGRLITIC